MLAGHDADNRTDDPALAHKTDRRTFLKQGLLAGATLAGATTGLPLPAHVTHRHTSHTRHEGRSSAARPPNLLVILVDQLRAPVWVPPSLQLDALLPNLAALRREAVSFERHYTASNDCSPARGALLTGLYSHQTGCMITGRSKLNPSFPTWGGLLRELGYQTTWWGKWHLNPHANASLRPYGFAGGTYPSPNGSPGQGTEMDPSIVDQFIVWLEEEGGAEPWCTTVSLVNPHDVAWWYRFTEEIPQEASPPQWISQLPPNFETPEQLAARGTPLLHRSLQDTAARSFGVVPFSGPDAVGMWSGLMNTYLLLQSYVDIQIGRVLAALAGSPRVSANTVVVFTSDHGEYGGSHGMRGKGAAAYEEAIRVPLYVRDPRGIATTANTLPRYGLTSSVDFVPLLLTLATGSAAWRRESSLAHLASRHDIAAMCANPATAGRPWVLHATDEDVTEFASEAHPADAPRHVIALRTPLGKLGVYANWSAESLAIEPSGQEVELYDYSTAEGRAELTSTAGASPLEEAMRSTLVEQAIPQELRAPLPGYLRAAQRAGINDFFDVEEVENESVARSHSPTPTSPETAPEPD
jgi:arylsulfatase A-like enzyme